MTDGPTRHSGPTLYSSIGSGVSHPSSPRIIKGGYYYDMHGFSGCTRTIKQRLVIYRLSAILLYSRLMVELAPK